MIPSYFKIEILAIRDEFVTQWHKGLGSKGLKKLKNKNNKTHKNMFSVCFLNLVYYCFPRRQIIFTFSRRVIYHSKVFESTFRNPFRLFVRLYHDHQTNGWTSIYPKSFMLNINGFVSTSSTKQLKASFFKFQISFRINGKKKRKIFTGIARREY